MVVARAGERADPPVPAPAALRPFTNFTRLNDRVAATVRRVLESDDDFRERVRDAVVASSVDEEAAGEAVGEPGWLLLDRPEGWEERLAGILDDALEDQARADRAREERREEKRRSQAASALEEVRAELAEAQAREDQHRAELEVAREELAAVRAELERHAAAIERLGEERAEAVRQLDEARRTVEERAEERRALRRAATDAKADASALRLELAHLRTELDAARSLALRPPSDRGGLDPAVRAELAGAIAEAAAAASALGGALARASTVVDRPAGAPDADEPSGAPDAAGAVPPDAGALPPEEAEGAAAAVGGGADDRAAAPGRGGVPVRRQPARLPVGVFDDSLEAAEHLVRIPGAVLIVDGYNVSLGAWPDLALAQQRRRLVEALRNLQARTGVEPVAVFDGGEVDSGPTGSLPRSVQVRFSPPGVTADDLVVDLVGHHPNDRAVVVATSDRELQDRARAVGANVVAAPQLAGLLRG